MAHGKPSRKWHTKRALAEIAELIEGGKLGEAMHRLKPFLDIPLETEFRNRVSILQAEIMLAKEQFREAGTLIKTMKKHFCGRDLARALEIEKLAEARIAA